MRLETVTYHRCVLYWLVFDPQVVIQPDDSDGYDTYIHNHSNYYPNESNYNYGAHTLLSILRSNFAAYHRERTLLKFDDLSSIPSGSAILEANLELFCNYVNSSSNQYPAEIDVHKMLLGNQGVIRYEGNQVGTPGLASWNSPNDIGVWGTPGGQAGVDYETAVTSAFTITGNAILNNWLAWDVTELVEDWVANPTGNYGVMLKLKDDHLSVYKYFRFDSSESSNVDLRPKLTVTYDTDSHYRVLYPRCCRAGDCNLRKAMKRFCLHAASRKVHS
ncbi:DNRLRE domain-containing protein [candidate division KSB1 bacterium]|nr:DNRLRE domain-containing protein [candidate division KSB1 bacterium]